MSKYRHRRKSLFLPIALIVGALFVAPAAASSQVTAEFYAHPGGRVRDGILYFPHAYVVFTGAPGGEHEGVDLVYGFTAVAPGPHLLAAPGRGVVAEPDPRYRDEGRAYFALRLSAEQYAAALAAIEQWREDPRYDLHRRNCIHFVAEVAQAVGLRRPATVGLSPRRFLLDLRDLNLDATAQDPMR